MAFFDADQSIDNSKLKEIELLVENNVEVYKKKDILYYEKDDVVLGVAGVLKEKNDGTLTGNVIAMAAETSDGDPIWDVSNFKYDSAKLEDQLKKGKLAKVTENLFKDKDTIWGSHFDDELYGFDGADEITGWRGNDALYGGKGEDELIGHIGDDKLNGGKGKDVLKGGKDSDTYVFDQKLTKGNVDTVYKMDVTEDSFELHHDIFTGLEKGKLDADQFKVGKHASGDEAQILYSKGHLLYDPDGAGSADAVKFANVPKDKDITHDLFFIS